MKRETRYMIFGAFWEIVMFIALITGYIAIGIFCGFQMIDNRLKLNNHLRVKEKEDNND